MGVLAEARRGAIRCVCVTGSANCLAWGCLGLGQQGDVRRFGCCELKAFQLMPAARTVLVTGPRRGLSAGLIGGVRPVSDAHASTKDLISPPRLKSSASRPFCA